MWNMIIGLVLDQGVKLAIQFGVPYAVDFLFSVQKWGIGPWLKMKFPNLAQDLTNLIAQLNAAASHPTPVAEKKRVMKRAQSRMRSQIGMAADTKGLD